MGSGGSALYDKALGQLRRQSGPGGTQSGPASPVSPWPAGGQSWDFGTALRCAAAALLLHHGARSNPDDDQLWTTDVDCDFIPSSHLGPSPLQSLPSTSTSRTLPQWSPPRRYHPVNSVGREPLPCHADVSVYVYVHITSVHIRPHTSTSHVHVHGPRFTTPHAALSVDLDRSGWLRTMISRCYALSSPSWHYGQ